MLTTTMLIYGQIFHLSKSKGVTFVRNIFNSYSVNNSHQGVLAPTGFLPNCMIFTPTKSGTSTGIVTGLSNGSIVVDMPSINKRDLKLLEEDKTDTVKVVDQKFLSHINDYFDNQKARDVRNKIYYDPTNPRQKIVKGVILRNERPVETPSVFQRFMGLGNGTNNPPAIRFELVGFQEGIHSLIDQTNRNLNRLERVNQFRTNLANLDNDMFSNETETRVFRANGAAELNNILVNEIRPIVNDLVETTNRVLSQTQALGGNNQVGGVNENTVRALDQIRNQIDMITGRQDAEFSQHTIGQLGGQNLSAAPGIREQTTAQNLTEIQNIVRNRPPMNLRRQNILDRLEQGPKKDHTELRKHFKTPLKCSNFAPILLHFFSNFLHF